MMNFQALSVRAKLSLAFAGVLALMVTLAAFSAWQLSLISDRTDEIMKFRLTGIRDSGRMLEWVPRLRTRELALPTATPAQVDGIVERLEASKAEFAKNSALYAEAIANADERALFDAAQAAWTTYIAHHPALLDAARAGRGDEAKRIVDGSGKQFEATLNAVRALGEYNDKLSVTDAAAAHDAYRHSLQGMGVLIAVAIAVAIGLAWWLTRAIAAPLRDAVDVAQAVAGGDLSTSAPHTEARGADEVARLSVALSQMVTQLRRVVGDVRDGVASVSLASSEIATGNMT